MQITAIYYYLLSYATYDEAQTVAVTSPQPLETWRDWIYFLHRYGVRRTPSDKLEEQHIYFSHLLLTELIKMRWDSKIYKRLDFTVSRAIKRELLAHATLLNRLIDLIQETCALLGAGDSVFDSPGHWFAAIWTEGVFDPKWLPESSYELGKERILKQMRSENRSLQTFDNPFDSRMAPAAWELFDRAIPLTSKFDIFRVDRYTPTVRARQALATEHSRHSQLTRISPNGDFIVKRQGVKKSGF